MSSRWLGNLDDLSPGQLDQLSWSKLENGLRSATTGPNLPVAKKVNINEGFDRLLVNLLPYALVPVTEPVLNEEIKGALPDIMKLYLVHNESIFSRFIFMGFPFHYWYTAQFLLILFVLLCLTYALLIGKINAKYNFIEEA